MENIDTIETDAEVVDENEELIEENTEDSQEDSSDSTPDNPEVKTAVKEQNRKGFELRQQQKAKKESVINSLSKELKEVKETLNALTETSKDADFRNLHPEVSDDLFNLIKSASKGSGKSYEDSLNDPVIKSVLDTSKSKNRIESSTPTPSTKTSPIGGKSVWDMNSDEFKAHQEEVLRRG